MLFNVLDEVFGHVDSFVLDPGLRSELESQTPGFYLDEPALRRKVSDAYAELKQDAESGWHAGVLLTVDLRDGIPFLASN